MDKNVDAKKRINELNLCLEDMARRNLSAERKIEIANNTRNELDFLSTKLTHSELMDPILKDTLSNSYRLCYFMATEKEPAERS